MATVSLLVLSWASVVVSPTYASTARGAPTSRGSPRLLSVVDTFQGCVNSTLLEEVVEVYYVDLEDVMAALGDKSLPGACYSFCLSKEAYSTRLSLTNPRGNTTYSCGCHMTEELEGLEEVDGVDDALCRQEGAAALYCGPDDRVCYNSAPHTQGAPATVLLAVLGALLARKNVLRT